MTKKHVAKALAIQIQGLHKRFGDIEVLKGIDLDIHQGEVVCLIGPSGSGKSTLLRCINLLETYDEGAVLIDGNCIGYSETYDGKRVPASAASVRDARRDLGMVFQQFNLWPHMSVLHNVTEALRSVKRAGRREAEARGAAMLEKVGLGDKLHSYPANLSGGQQQRVAIARALAMEPSIMLFDEPTSALDPELVDDVLNVMRNLADEGMTMIVVTHEMGFAAEVADRVVFLEDGRLVIQGSPDAIFNASDDPRLERFLGSWNRRNVSAPNHKERSL
ncbi:amino acid ABC transporter ATP-binding protein (PAAT family) [Pseudodesulfovibrio indicus]|jgi:polar amino acid transport system ATP-binding protein|uniref:Amino acid ABC transporter ATP-binding protein (PAAT family) n=1 Tax=Pseudodesulfovibrio indicus TaxID=1716143 RepID=A0AA94PN29_9BACT|nr:amino acid ABC transporter ATP-binding protein [Pseudodesulfovibrio indicus]TDT90851.1 amino acid ABC transporter ATP-binding protein (PAAT family) [Pseudodesulfovibrio indicus]